jgi:hypothetical protein
MRRSLPLRLSLAATLTAACVSDSSVNDVDPGDSGGGADAGATEPGDADAGATGPGDDGSHGTWRTLVDGAWEMQPGTEGYRCVYKTVEQDLYINEFDAVAPLGTHHTVLTVGEPRRPDGVYDCDAATNMQAQIYGSGVGTNPIAFPEGVGVKIPAGQQLLLNLHLFNVSDQVITGVSGTRIKTIAPEQLQHEAEAVLMGKVLTLAVPPGDSTQIGTCEMNGDVTVFAMQPHMHQLGSHMKVVAERASGGDVTLWDQPYSFDEQIASRVGPVQLAKGDSIRVHCSYRNTTGKTVRFGDSSLEEMCFAGVYRYPKLGGGRFGFICAAD